MRRDRAASPPVTARATGPIKHRIMFAEYPPGKLVEFNPDGTVFWETNGPSTIFMFNVLPNDDIFFPFAGGGKTGAQVVNRKYQVVWTYTSTSQQVGGGERLSNGHTLLGEQGPPRALEIDDKGATVAAFDLPTSETRFDHQVRHIHRLSNGNTLVAMEGEGVARELDPKGKVVWEYAAGGAVQDALRVDCGNTFITTGDKKTIVEVTPEGTVAWEFKASDAPETILTFFTSLQQLRNGNLVVGNWTRAENLPGVHAFEVTHDSAKKVVWKFENHGLLQAGMAVTVLDDK